MAHAESKTPDSGKRLSWLFPVSLLLILMVVFAPVVLFDFAGETERCTLWFEPCVSNLTWNAAGKALIGATLGREHPLAAVSFGADAALWHGLFAAGFHATSVLLHAANAWLVFLLVARVLDTGEPTDRRIPWIAWAAAGLFAIHVVMVEPVAWISARGHLLAAFFTLMCVHLHLLSRQAQQAAAAVGRRHSGTAIVSASLAALSGAAACLSHPVGVVVPVLVFLADWVVAPGERLRNRLGATAAVWAAGLAAIAWIGLTRPTSGFLRAAANGADAVTVSSASSWALAAVQTYGHGVRSLVWPVNLTPFGPRGASPHLWQMETFFGLAAILLTLLAIWRTRRNRVVFLGLLWLVMSATVNILAIPAHEACGDRILYLPMVGVALLVGAALMKLTALVSRRAIVVVCTSLLAALAVGSVRHRPVWRDGVTLAEYVVQVRPDDPDARKLAAIEQFHAQAMEAALAHLQEACRLQPDDADVHLNMGVVYRYSGKWAEALACCATALRLQPRMHDAHSEIGEMLVHEDRFQEALAAFQAAVDLAPRNARGRRNLAATLAYLGEMDEAAAQYAVLIELSPRDSDAHREYADVLRSLGRSAEAVLQYQEAFRYSAFDPAMLANNLAWLRATGPDAVDRGGTEAVLLAEWACGLTERAEANYLDTLAAAYAEAGRFDDAVATAKEAVVLADRLGDEWLEGEIVVHLKSFEVAKPWREPQ
ncbi:MAG: tetratricopeptide repeat protein [Phycisphaerae bacterium]|nr:tetratricopeptide repeat protein [Phycisphaerae bacterium]